MTEYFNAFNWFKYYTRNKKLNKKNSRSLLHFSLMWSLFEQTYFNEAHQLNTGNLHTFLELVSHNLNQETYIKYIHHFHNRYFNQGEHGERLFEALNLYNNDELNVRDTIQRIAPFEYFVPALLLIAYRFRNNFMHGRKDPIKLHLYRKEFNCLNKFLSEFIEQTGNDVRYNVERFYNYRN